MITASQSGDSVRYIARQNGRQPYIAFRQLHFGNPASEQHFIAPACSWPGHFIRLDFARNERNGRRIAE